ncbi:MAG TPA: MFS transporter [Candidatus Dormibacteraeota bacterium]|nr:MFS transporter [Candidatus Dormibacteraeota bacterium]
MNSQVLLTESTTRLRWAAVLAVGLSLFLSALDSTIVALALPEIANRFQVSNSLVAAVTLSYAIPLTLLILPAGALIGRFRPLHLFVASVLGFGLSSAACGLAPNFPVLLAARAVQGSFAAIIATQGLALAAAVVLPRERGRAMGIVGTVAPLGGVVGPGVGGILLASYDWSSIFFVNLPIVLVASLTGLLSLRGVVLKGTGRGSSRDSNKTNSLLRNPRFLSGLLAFFFSVSASVALYYFLPFDLSGIQHIDSALSGLLLLCVPLGMVSIGVAGGYLTDRYHARPFILAGSGLLFIGSIALSLVVSTSTSELDLAWRLFLIGVGVGLFTGPNMSVIMNIGGREKIASASAISNLAGRLASVVGPLAVGVAWTLIPTFSGQMIIGVLLVDVFAAATLLFALLSGRRDRGRPNVPITECR